MKLSIITPTLNSAPFLEECIYSIVSQGPYELEHIIVDGGSADETIFIARKHAHVIVVERPGCSIYEAYNIGIGIATGDLIGLCNSDDLYAPDTFARALQAASLNPEAWLISGKAIEFSRDAGQNVFRREYADKKNERLRFEDLELLGPAPNARFFSRRVFARFGQFDTRFRIAADCAYMMEVALNELPVVTMDQIFYYYRSHALSSSLGGNISNLILSLDEKLTIGQEFICAHPSMKKSNFGHLLRALALQFVSTLVQTASARRWRETMAAFRCLRRLSLANRVALVEYSAGSVLTRLFEKLRRRLN
jgi:glycosyltransferase